MKISVWRMVFCYACFLLITSLGSAFAADVEFPEGALSSDRISELVSGKSVEAEAPDQDSRDIYFQPDGEIRQIRQGKYYERGTWRVRDGRLCIKVRGDRDCRFVVKDAEGYKTLIPKKNNRHKLDERLVSFSAGNILPAKMEMELSRGVSLPPGTLNSEEVMELFYDKTVESVTAVKKRESRSYYDPSGEVSQYRNGDKRTGFWEVRSDGRICLQMENLPKKCRIIVQEGDEYKKYIVKKNGRHVHSVSYPEFRNGNPYHL